MFSLWEARATEQQNIGKKTKKNINTRMKIVLLPLLTTIL